jgi:tRNA pseudouridine13 synthase
MSERITLPDWPRAHGGPVASGLLKKMPEDFRVDECLGFELAGEGPFVWLQIEKTGANSPWIARRLADLAGLPLEVVGLAGLKDRHAVTRQWFSLPLAQQAEPDWQVLNGDGLRVLRVVRHADKLRRGDHLANRFQLRLRQVRGDRTACERLLLILEREGFPNYFGEQRFGIDNANLHAARDWFAGGPPPGRSERGFCLSASRAWLFNQVLARRVEQGNWYLPLAGDLLENRSSGRCIPVAGPDERLRGRCRSLELCPTGPLHGSGEPKPNQVAGVLEAAVLAGQVEWARGLERQRMRPERRALRAVPSSLAWYWEDDDLLLAFELGRGSYATALLRELMHY